MATTATRGACPLLTELPVVICESQWGPKARAVWNLPHIGILFRMFDPTILVFRVEPQYLSEPGQEHLRARIEQYKDSGWLEPEHRTNVHRYGARIEGVRADVLPGIIIDLQQIARDYATPDDPPRPLSPAETLRRWLKAAQ